MSQNDSVSVGFAPKETPQVTMLACLFVVFSIGILLPLLYEFGVPFYSYAQVELPVLTSLFSAIPAWAMIATAITVCAALVLVRQRCRANISQWFNWLVVVVTGAVTILGALAFLMPAIAVMSGLRS